MGDFDSNKYKQEFAKNKYDRVPLDIPKGQKAVIAQYAKEHGFKSLNNFIWQCIQDAINTNKANSQNINIGEINQTGDSNSIQF